MNEVTIYLDYSLCEEGFFDGISFIGKLKPYRFSYFVSESPNKRREKK